MHIFAGCSDVNSRIMRGFLSFIVAHLFLNIKTEKTRLFELVWVVMQLTSSVVTTLASPLTLLQNINRGRDVHERGLGFYALLC